MYDRGPAFFNDPLGNNTPVIGNVTRTRELMYRLMVSQLFYDGHQSLAAQLTNLVQAEPACPPSDRLMHVVALGLEQEAEAGNRKLNKVEEVSRIFPNQPVSFSPQIKRGCEQFSI